MPDAVDMAVEIEGELLAHGLAQAARPIEAGVSGECDECEWWMPRLVGGRCGFCRDGRARPDDWEPPVPPAATILKNNTTPVAAPIEERIMSGKSIMLPAAAANAIAAVVARASAGDISLGQAAADLIERGVAAAPVELAVPEAMTPRERMVALLDGVSDLLIEQIEAAAAPSEDPAVVAERDAWKVRAEAAEERLAAMKQLLAA